MNAEVQESAVCQVKNEWSFWMTDSLIETSEMIFLLRSDSWIDYMFKDVISRLINSMLCIIMLFKSLIYSDNKSRITSTIINTKLFIISRF